MTLLALIVVLVAVGIVLALVPMEARIKQVVIVLTVLFAVLCLLNIFGIVSLGRAKIT